MLAPLPPLSLFTWVSVHTLEKRTFTIPNDLGRPCLAKKQAPPHLQRQKQPQKTQQPLVNPAEVRYQLKIRKRKKQQKAIMDQKPKKYPTSLLATMMPQQRKLKKRKQLQKEKRNDQIYYYIRFLVSFK